MYEHHNQPLYNTSELFSTYHIIKQPTELPGVSNVHYAASSLTQNIAGEAPLPSLDVSLAVNKVQENDGKRPAGRLVVDTSAFSVEERLIAAVWVHERKHSKTSMTQIKRDFLQRFGRQPPAKNTLLVWERKLFSSGSIHDAPRPGRPVNRRSKMEEVSQSLRGAPSLSLRARAAALRLPRTTLRTILRTDLRHAANAKRPSKKPTKKQSQPALPPAPALPLYHGYS